MKHSISVIIPVYNVELYISKCIQSLLDQTFRDFELIIVDDVSPDDSIAVAEELLKNQQEISWKIIRRELNGGLSAARNSGIDIAQGKYLSFIDSDDWVNPDMLKTLFDTIENESADIVACNRIEEFSNRSAPVPGAESFQTLSRQEALDQIFSYGSISVAVWDKLFLTKLFLENNIRFPHGVFYEDVPTLLRVISASNKVVAIPDYFYHYRQRTGSIMKQVRLKSITDYTLMLRNISDFMSEVKMNQLKSYRQFQMGIYNRMLQLLFEVGEIPIRENYMLAKEIHSKLLADLKSENLEFRSLKDKIKYWVLTNPILYTNENIYSKGKSAFGYVSKYVVKGQKGLMSAPTVEK